MENQRPQQQKNTRNTYILIFEKKRKTRNILTNCHQVKKVSTTKKIVGKTGEKAT